MISTVNMKIFKYELDWKMNNYFRSTYLTSFTFTVQINKTIYVGLQFTQIILIFLSIFYAPLSDLSRKTEMWRTDKLSMGCFGIVDVFV